MNIPNVIHEDSFQQAWLSASRVVMQNNWVTWNLVVQVNNPSLFDEDFNITITDFYSENSFLSPKAVCYTIFPFGLYTNQSERQNFYDNYINRFFPRSQRILRQQRNYSNWGTYFSRMINYQINGGIENQIENIITAINDRTTVSSAAYTIVIERPGSETTRRMGAPCLNYIAIQLDSGSPVRLGLLATYRNHDFLKRAYGNYWGLCRLQMFLCSETNCVPGPLTCISSRAYVDSVKRVFRQIISEL